MADRNDGGPAFPSQPPLMHIAEDGTPRFVGEGMTLRDWFAGQATDEDVKVYRKWHPMTGASYGGGRYDCTREQARYRFADAMLAAREKEGV